MSSGVTRSMSGSFVGTAATVSIRTLNFRPKFVKIINATGVCFAEWCSSMPDASAMKTVTAGTTSYITTLGITPLSNGFSLGADTDLNVAAETVYWFATE
ncbi:MAG: hypothetical protein BV456_00735 [Thermoplasmata archaeon M8B2D]|nr:MAG: hypothetical protein BV456_00735 [Thermoplasmata archaeon M8B2D]